MTAGGRRLRIAGAALLLGLSQVSAASAGIEIPAELPADSPEIGSVERQALVDFQRDPVANGKELLRLSTGSARRLPVIVLLAAGDVHLRAGRLRAATRFFREAGRRQSGPPWDTFAELGLGWTALARHDFPAAAKYYRSVDPQGPLGGIARVMMAWLTAFRGQYAEAMPIFDGAAAAADLPPNVRQVAMLGAGYTRYWTGSFDEAATAFDRLVSPPSVLSDDARYGAAWSRVRADQLDTAIPALVALAGEAADATPTKRISEAAVTLTPSTVARSGRESTARISGFAGPDARMVAMFDGDGSALARAALALLLRRGELAGHPLPPALLPALPLPMPEGGDVPAADERRPASSAGARPMAPSNELPTAGSAWWRAWGVAMGILVLAVVVAILRRGDARTSPHAR